MALPIKLEDILAYLGQFAPWDLAEPWDNVGLMIGNPGQEVTGVLVTLDATLPVLEEAVHRKINVILTHHPLIFHPLKTINTATPIGRFLQRALRHDIAVISCHTNLDVISNGVSHALAHALELQDTRPIRPKGDQPGQGFGQIGILPTPMGSASFLQYAAQRLQVEGMVIAGTPPDLISTVAVCGGSGADLAEEAFQAGAQIYLTAELKHAVARWAEEAGACILDGSHFATENLIISHLVNRLSGFFKQNNSAAPVIAARQKNPLRFYISDHFTLQPQPERGA